MKKLQVFVRWEKLINWNMRGWILANSLLLAGGWRLDAAALHYEFAEGEPLDYQLKLTALIQSDVNREMGRGSEQDRRVQRVELTVDCRLMPIFRETNGVTKVRVVLDRIEQTSVQDGETVVRRFSREGLVQERDGQVVQRTFFDVAPAPVFGKGEAPAWVETVSAAELFDEPILLRIGADGTWQDFDDRSLLSKVLPALDLKTVLELIFVRLPAEQDAGWSSVRKLDSPGTGELPDGQEMPVRFTRQDNLVQFKGAADFKGLRIPIGSFEEKWLVWTTHVTAVSDSLEGTVAFQSGVIQKAGVRSRYRCQMRTDRQEDKGRRHADETLTSDLTIEFVRTASTPATAGVVESK